MVVSLLDLSDVVLEFSGPVGSLMLFQVRASPLSGKFLQFV